MIKKQKNIFKKLFKIETVSFIQVKINLTKLISDNLNKILINGFEIQYFPSKKTDILDFLIQL